MTLDQALAAVARHRAPLLRATRSRPAAEQEAVSAGPLGVQYRAAVIEAERLWREHQEWERQRWAEGRSYAPAREKSPH